ncbi:hypothetical protein Celaphus_00001729, partial [Cervus elaphus hippelaphus]
MKYQYFWEKPQKFTEGQASHKVIIKTEWSFELGGSKDAAFPQLSQIQVHLAPVDSTMPTNLDPNDIRVVYLRCTSGEVGATSALAPKIGPLALSPKKVGDDITKATGDRKGLRITVKLTIHNRQAQIEVVPSTSALIIKALQYKDRRRKTLSTDEITLLMSLIKEILETAQSVGCSVDGCHFHDINR